MRQALIIGATVEVRCRKPNALQSSQVLAPRSAKQFRRMRIIDCRRHVCNPSDRSTRSFQQGEHMHGLARLISIGLSVLLLGEPVLAATTCQSVVLPSYMTTGSGSDFYKVFGSPQARSRVLTIAIGPCGDPVNLTPCVRPQDPVDESYRDVVKAAKSLGIKVLAYIWTNQGDRLASEMKAEIDLYKSRYQVDGVFFDGVPNETDDQTYLHYKSLSDYVKLSRGGFVVLNFGAQPESANYFRIADIIVTFEGKYSEYINRWTEAPAWMAAIPASKVAHLVHTTPFSNAAMRAAVTLSQARNASSIYVTDAVKITKEDNPWNRLPKFWQAELDKMMLGCS